MPTEVQLMTRSHKTAWRDVHSTCRQPTSVASAWARSEVRLVIVTRAPSRCKAWATARATPPAPSTITTRPAMPLAGGGAGGTGTDVLGPGLVVMPDPPPAEAGRAVKAPAGKETW